MMLIDWNVWVANGSLILSWKIRIPWRKMKNKILKQVFRIMIPPFLLCHYFFPWLVKFWASWEVWESKLDTNTHRYVQFAINTRGQRMENQMSQFIAHNCQLETGNEMYHTPHCSPHWDDFLTKLQGRATASVKSPNSAERHTVWSPLKAATANWVLYIIYCHLGYILQHYSLVWLHCHSHWACIIWRQAGGLCSLAFII